MDRNSELKGSAAQETGRGSQGDTGEGELNRKRYLDGKRDFWRVALCETVIRACYLCVIALNGINGANVPGEALGYFLLAMMLFLSYQGHRWAWYLYFGIMVFNLFQFSVFTVLLISRWYWMRYILTHSMLAGYIIEFAGILAMAFFMIIKRNAGYFIKCRKMERKKKSGGQTVKEENSREG